MQRETLQMKCIFCSFSRLFKLQIISIPLALFSSSFFLDITWLAALVCPIYHAKRAWTSLCPPARRAKPAIREGSRFFAPLYLLLSLSSPGLLRIMSSHSFLLCFALFFCSERETELFSGRRRRSVAARNERLALCDKMTESHESNYARRSLGRRASRLCPFSRSAGEKDTTRTVPHHLAFASSSLNHFCT